MGKDPFSCECLDGWRYNPGGFDQVFQPLSEVCKKDAATGASSWSKTEMIE